MISLVESLILGVIQGITEYLPVSSSGHLVITQALFGLDEPALFFDIVLHIGTLSSVFWYYWSDLRQMASESVTALQTLATKRGAWAAVNEKYPAFRMVFLIGVGTIPTGLIGVLFKDDFEKLFGAPGIAGMMLLVTAAILFATRFFDGKGVSVGGMSVAQAIIIGVVQGIAITPGISRSGSTIATALFLGIERETAARFSFLLSIPSILGALILKFDPGSINGSLLPYGLGLVTSALTGAACLTFLVAIVKKGRLHWFSYYCVAAGLFTIYYVA